MRQKTLQILSIFFLFLLSISFFSSIVNGVGLSPPQLRIENAPIGEKTGVATLVVTNTGGSEPAYMIFKLSCLEKTREQKLRVICLNCSRDVGIQRGDLINGTCPFCGASGDKLIFYDLPPDDVMTNMTISCDEYPLEAYANGLFKTKEKVPTGAEANIDIIVNIPNKKEYYGQHWELRIMATTVTDLNATKGMSMIYGAETKFLVDTVEKPAETKNQVNLFFILGGLIIIGVGMAIGCGLIFRHRMKKIPSSRKSAIKNTIQRGRKIL